MEKELKCMSMGTSHQVILKVDPLVMEGLPAWSEWVVKLEWTLMILQFGTNSSQQLIYNYCSLLISENNVFGKNQVCGHGLIFIHK